MSVHIQKAIVSLRKIESELLTQLHEVRENLSVLEGVASAAAPKKQRKLSRAGRAAIAKAARKRWDKYRREKAAKAKARAATR